MNVEARTPARVSVNQAPSGTLVRAEERYKQSTQAMRSQGRKTTQGLRRQTIRAARVTMQVSKKVTNMTQTLFLENSVSS
jgi:hypothetical protein